MLLIGSIHAFGQYGFQKIYEHPVIDTFSIISDIYVLDSIPFITLGSGKGMSRIDFRFGSVNQEGDYQNINQYNDTGHLQRSMFSSVDTDTNFRGNLVNCYRNTMSFENSFRLIEYGLDGQIYLDSVYSDFWVEDSIQFFDYSKLLHLKDSSYLLNLNYIDKKVTSSTYEVQGTILLKIDYNGEIIWEKKVYSGNQINPIISGRNLIETQEDTFKLHYMELKNFAPSNAEQNWALQKFVTIDGEGNILDEKQFQDGQYCVSYYGSYFDEDTSYLQYYDSKIFGNPPNNEYFKHMPFLSRIDENMDTVWRIQLSNFWHTAASVFTSIQKIRKINDTTFVAAYGYSEEIEYNLYYKYSVRIFKFFSNGNIIWHRDYYYYNIDLYNDPYYEIKDLEIMPDGGFIMGGQVFNIDLFNANKPCQFAYLLRTNCLGFLNPPEAALSYESDENEVLFINNSISAGSYTYYFGDGDTLHTGEDIDSLVHTYENEGDYEVTLIAHGCNGSADTLTLQVSVEIEEEFSGTVGDGFFTIYPNPVIQGELFTIETGNIDNSTLYFYDMNGKCLKKVPLPNAKSIYFTEHNFASDMYVAKLIKDGAVLGERKLVVQ